MKNLTIDRALKVKVNFTADQWQLYSSSSSLTPLEDPEMARNTVAATLNSVMAASINSGNNRRQVERDVGSAMQLYWNWGALDSEPVRFLDEVLDKIFNGDED